MPYISNKHLARDRLDPTYNIHPHSAGELNFVITRLCDAYLGVNGTNYDDINKIIGALECAKMEFYRRIAAPYEDQKIKENGDVYDATLLQS